MTYDVACLGLQQRLQLAALAMPLVCPQVLLHDPRPCQVVRSSLESVLHCHSPYAPFLSLTYGAATNVSGDSLV